MVKFKKAVETPGQKAKQATSYLDSVIIKRRVRAGSDMINLLQNAVHLKFLDSSHFIPCQTCVIGRYF